MFKLNWGAKIGLIGGAIGGLVGLAAPIITMGGEGWVISGIIFAIFFTVYWFFIRPFFVAGKLMKTGEQRQAKILEIWDTGVTVNNNPQIGMKVEITRKDGTKYETKIRSVVSRLQVQYFQPGTEIVVRVDPQHEDKAAIESIGAMDTISTPPGPTKSALVTEDYKAQLEKILMETEMENQELIKTGVQAKAKVIWYSDLNIKVNGDNPDALLFLEVQPQGQPSFFAEVKGAISQVSLPKFVPGSMITVRYDQNNLKKVTVEHSGV